MKQLKIILLSANIVALIAQFGVSILRSDTGPKLTKIYKNSVAYEKENELLKEQIYSARSLSEVEKVALGLNLKSIKTTSMDPLPVASARQ